jgi:hypothetical protein
MRWKKRDRLTPDISIWHSHFCWVPTVVDGYYVWLETVQTRMLIIISQPYSTDTLSSFYTKIEYRFKPSGGFTI